MKKCIAAYTEPNDWPAFINVSRVDNGIKILMRDGGNQEMGASLNMIELVMPVYDFIKFVEDLKKEFGEGRSVKPHRSGRHD